MSIQIRCEQCKKACEVPITQEQLTQWQASGELVQRAFPFLSDGQRELLICGTCQSCFDAMFETDDSDAYEDGESFLESL